MIDVAEHRDLYTRALQCLQGHTLDTLRTGLGPGDTKMETRIGMILLAADTLRSIDIQLSKLAAGD